ncbi:MAG TPA: hypothetical protein PLS04_03185, partial [Mycobacterium sp.]|nr:hypothetical protein [Mycobacterium sp.]
MLQGKFRAGRHDEVDAPDTAVVVHVPSLQLQRVCAFGKVVQAVAHLAAAVGVQVRLVHIVQHDGGWAYKLGDVLT